APGEILHGPVEAWERRVGSQDQGRVPDRRPGPAARKYLPPPTGTDGGPLRRAVQHRRRPLAELWPGGRPGQGPAAGGCGGFARHGRPLRLRAGAGPGRTADSVISITSGANRMACRPCSFALNPWLVDPAPAVVVKADCCGIILSV